MVENQQFSTPNKAHLASIFSPKKSPDHTLRHGLIHALCPHRSLRRIQHVQPRSPSRSLLELNKLPKQTKYSPLVFPSAKRKTVDFIKTEEIVVASLMLA